MLFETVKTKSLNRLFPLVSNIDISSAIEGHRDSFKQLPFICGRPRYWCKLMSLNCDWWMADGSTGSRWLTRTSAPPGKITRPSWEAASLSIARWEGFSSKLGALPGFKDNKEMWDIFNFFFNCLFPRFVQVENIGTSTLIWKKDNRIIRSVGKRIFWKK